MLGSEENNSENEFYCTPSLVKEEAGCGGRKFTTRQVMVRSMSSLHNGNCKAKCRT